jgi:hypothetical protein
MTATEAGAKSSGSSGERPTVNCSLGDAPRSGVI